jgi:hypothetical protein
METKNENGLECLLIPKLDRNRKTVVQNLLSIKYDLYYTHIKPQNIVIKTIFKNPESYRICMIG